MFLERLHFSARNARVAPRKSQTFLFSISFHWSSVCFQQDAKARATERRSDGFGFAAKVAEQPELQTALVWILAGDSLKACNLKM